MCWYAIVGLDYCLDMKKLQERKDNEILFIYQEIIRTDKKIDKIKINSVWLKIVTKIKAEKW